MYAYIMPILNLYELHRSLNTGVSTPKNYIDDSGNVHRYW